jgi:hypothetical protein
MKARWKFRAAPALVVVLALALLAGPRGASSERANVPVPLGYWTGVGKLADVDAKVGDVDVHIRRGEYVILLTSDPKKESLDVAGFLTLDLFGSGQLTVNGVTATGNLNFEGEFELGDLPGSVYADGSYHMTGVVIVEGFPVNIDQVIAVTSPLTVTDATCKKITGELPSGIGAYRWTAKLRDNLGVKCS